MKLTLVVGTWIFPVLATIILFGWASWVEHKHSSHCLNFEGFLAMIIALIFSLVSWLVWALLR